MNHVMDTCIQLNNSGVQHLQNCQYGDAANHFTEALRLSKGILSFFESQRGDSGMDVNRQPETDDRSNSKGPCSRSDACCAVVTPLHRCENDNESIDKLSSEWEAHHQFVYRTPLQLSESVHISNYESSVEISVAIMFNMALSHHLHALHGHVQGRDVVLGQAVALYELAYTVQMQEEIELSVECTMAIINNLGQIHGVLGNQEKSCQCFRNLLSTILFLQSYGEATSETEGFVQSVSHLILKETAAPAA
jgi:hypothetical protein